MVNPAMVNDRLINQSNPAEIENKFDTSQYSFDFVAIFFALSNDLDHAQYAKCSNQSEFRLQSSDRWKPEPQSSEYFDAPLSCWSIQATSWSETKQVGVMADQENRNAGQVRSLTRALSILKHLAASSDGMSLTELSEAAQLPPSTTHRLLTTLEAERFVRPDSQGGLWRVGVAAFFVGSSFARSRDTLTLVRPYLRRLMEMTGETSNLFVESDAEAVCIGQIESRHAMRALTGIGGRVMLHTSGAGKVMLAHMDQNRRDMLMRQINLSRATDKSIVDERILLASLEKVRNQGFAIDDEEHALGLRCVAAPIFNEFGDAIAAVSVSGPTARIPDSRLKALGETVSHAAREATRDFGGDASMARAAS